MIAVPRHIATLVLLLAIALAAVGWGHRLAQAGDAEADMRLQVHLQAGGDAALICGTGPAAATKAPCDACRLTDAPGLPDAGFRPASDLSAGRAMYAPSGSAAGTIPPCHPGWNGRAPPLV